MPSKSFLFLAALGLSNSEAKISFGACPETKYMADFDAARYSGKWYEIVRDRMNLHTLTADCVTKEFAPLNTEQESMDLYFRGYYYIKMGYMGIDGTLYQCDEGSPSTFTCQATMGPSPHRSPIRIWHTDYDTFDISYDCSEMFGGRLKSESFSVAARQPEISQETRDRVNAVIRERIPHYDLDTASGLYWTKQ